MWLVCVFTLCCRDKEMARVMQQQERTTSRASHHHGPPDDLDLGEHSSTATCGTCLAGWLGVQHSYVHCHMLHTPGWLGLSCTVQHNTTRVTPQAYRLYSTNTAAVLWPPLADSRRRRVGWVG